MTGEPGPMNDKLLAGLFTAAVIAPLCAVCILGPALLGSMLAVAFGWIADLRPVVTTGLAIIAAILVYGIMRRRKAKAATRRDSALYPSQTKT